jgi:hypothetical protein
MGTMRVRFFKFFLHIYYILYSTKKNVLFNIFFEIMISLSYTIDKFLYESVQIGCIVLYNNLDPY